MAARITINAERCKSCGLCVAICPRDCITISEQSNKNGYFPATAPNSGCSGCARCAIVCPEAIIEICLDQVGRIPIAAAPGKRGEPRPVEEKA